MWTVIILVVLLILGKFFWDRHKMEQAIKKKGGMKVVYGGLISRLLETHPKCKIFHEKPTYISLGVADAFTVTLFELIPTFGSVSVTYNVSSNFFGKHKLQWEFDDKEDPDFMIDKIETDIESYLQNIKQFKNMKIN